MSHTVSSSSHPAPLLGSILGDFRAHRAARLARRELEAELASYTTPADLDDLEAVLSRSDSDDADVIKRLNAA